MYCDAGGSHSVLNSLHNYCKEMPFLVNPWGGGFPELERSFLGSQTPQVRTRLGCESMVAAFETLSHRGWLEDKAWLLLKPPPPCTWAGTRRHVRTPSRFPLAQCYPSELLRYKTSPRLSFARSIDITKTMQTCSGQFIHSSLFPHP